MMHLAFKMHLSCQVKISCWHSELIQSWVLGLRWLTLRMSQIIPLRNSMNRIYNHTKINAILFLNGPVSQGTWRRWLFSGILPIFSEKWFYYSNFLLIYVCCNGFFFFSSSWRPWLGLYKHAQTEQKKYLQHFTGFHLIKITFHFPQGWKSTAISGAWTHLLMELYGECVKINTCLI